MIDPKSLIGAQTVIVQKRGRTRTFRGDLREAARYCGVTVETIHFYLSSPDDIQPPQRSAFNYTAVT